MSQRYSEIDPEVLRAKIIGLGKRSFKKSYYPELQRRLSELERFRELLDESNDAIFLLDRVSAQVLDVNASACRQLDRPRAAMLQLSLYDLLPHDSAQKLRASIGLGGRDRLTTTLRRADGTVLPVELAFRVMNHGPVEYVVAVARDVAERLYVENELRHAKEIAEAGDRAKSEFLAIASHELRTPLAALKLMIERCLQAVQRSESITVTVLERMGSRADRLALLIEDLVDASRLEHGILRLRPRRIELTALLTSVLEEFRERLPQRQISLVGASPVVIDADAARVEQVMANLLDNACKYSPEHSPIEVRVTVEATEVTISVTDHGRGLSEAERDRLFARFSQPPSLTHHAVGLGLGLHISNELIRLHGGRFAVRSVVHKGSTFSFTLPR